MRAWRVVSFGVVSTVCAACGESAGPADSTTPYTGPAIELAPSQLSRPTVPGPSAPGRCEPGSLATEARPGEPPDADVVVTFHNSGRDECEVDVGLAWATAHQIEPSVRLAPGATAELWGVAGTGDCADDERVAVWDLTVNGVALAVALPERVCALTPAAFFPA